MIKVADWVSIFSYHHSSIRCKSLYYRWLGSYDLGILARMIKYLCLFPKEWIYINFYFFLPNFDHLIKK